MRRLIFLVAMTPAAAISQEPPEWLSGLPRPLIDGGVFGMAWWQWLALAIFIPISTVAAALALRAVTSLPFVRSWFRHSAVTAQNLSRLQRASVLFIGLALYNAIQPQLNLSETASGRYDVILAFLQIVSGSWLTISFWEAVCDIYGARVDESIQRSATLILPFVRTVGRVTIGALGCVGLVALFGYDVRAILAGLGIGGIAVALAAKDSIENLFGAFTLVVEVPFGVGDWVKVGDVEGKVEESNMRSTRIRTAEDSLITLPNSNLIKASVENFGMRRARRLRNEIVLEQSTPVDRVKAVSAEVVRRIEALPMVQEDSARATISAVSTNGLILQIICFVDVDSLREELAARQEVLLEAVDAIRSLEVQMARTAPPPA